MKKIFFGQLFIAIFLTGCNANNQSASGVAGSSKIASKENTMVEAEVQIDLTTPDKALKSYWAVRDVVRKREHSLTQEGIPKFVELQAPLKQVTSGMIVKDFQYAPTEMEKFSRDIEDIKVETESRAVIVAILKNITPIPVGAEVSKYDEERRREGERVRYVMEKDQTGWRVAEIWQWVDYPKPNWKKSHPSEDKPHVASFAYDAI